MSKTSLHLRTGRNRRSPTVRHTDRAQAAAAEPLGELGARVAPTPLSARRQYPAGQRSLVIRDSFTMPIVDYELIGALKKRCLALGIAIKKSEVLRAGVATLHRLSDESLVQMVATIESVRTGRPPGIGKKKKKSNRSKDRKS